MLPYVRSPTFIRWENDPPLRRFRIEPRRQQLGRTGKFIDRVAVAAVRDSGRGRKDRTTSGPRREADEIAGTTSCGIALGIVLILAGFLVFLFSTEISNRLSGYFPADPGLGYQIAPGFSYTWYVPYMVWGFGFALIGIGAGLLRMVFFTSVYDYVCGGGMAGEGGMPLSPDLIKQMEASLSRAEAAQAAEKAVVKVKCRNCAHLEPEDAVYCRKCGKPL